MAPNIKNLLGQLQFTSKCRQFKKIILVVLKTLLDEELSKTQRHLDLSGVTMPNFMNIGSSLRRELNEYDAEESDDDYSVRQGLDSYPLFNTLSRTVHTPDLIVEEEESDSEHSQLSITEVSTEEGKLVWENSNIVLSMSIRI